MDTKDTMRKVLLLVLVGLISFGVNAQNNVNINNLNFSYKERRQPKKPLNPKRFDYAVALDMPNTVRAVLDEDAMSALLKVQGQRLLETPTNTDYLLRMTLGELKGIVTNVKNRYIDIKDKEGRVVNKEQRFWVEVIYDMDATGEFTKGGNEVYKYYIMNDIPRVTYKSAEFRTRKEATDYWTINKDELKEDFTQDIVSRSLSLLTSRVSEDYGYPVTEHTSFIKTINERTHQESTALRENSADLKKRLEILDGTIPMTESELSEIITYFKELPSRYTDDKLNAHIRLRYVAYYNLSRIYMFLDQPEKVTHWTNLLKENGHDKADADVLLREADRLKIYLDGTDERVRQFDPRG